MVGAGPGDPELLTLRAVRALQSADVILFDDLVSRDVLDFARREARKMLVGKTGFGPSCKQDDINALMVSLAKQGKRVVRLKGGDPLIFGRAAEEIAACQAAAESRSTWCPASPRRRARRAGSAFRSPTASMPAGCNTSPATRTTARCRWTSIGRASPIRPPPRRSTCRSARLAALVEKATAEGLDPQTPALAIARATRPDQAVVSAPIGELPARLAQAALPGPVLVMLGRVFGEYAGAKSSVAARGSESRLTNSAQRIL